MLVQLAHFELGIMQCAGHQVLQIGTHQIIDTAEVTRRDHAVPVYLFEPVVGRAQTIQPERAADHQLHGDKCHDKTHTRTEIQVTQHFSRALPPAGTRRAPFAHQRIERGRGFNLRPGRFGAYREITGDLAALANRRDVGLYPVVVAVFAAVFNDAVPRLARLHGIPQILESRRRHVGMTHQIVRLPDQLAFGKTADLDKLAVDIGHDTLGVGLRNDLGAVAQLMFDGCNGLVIPHGGAAPVNAVVGRPAPYRGWS